MYSYFEMISDKAKKVRVYFVSCPTNFHRYEFYGYDLTEIEKGNPEIFDGLVEGVDYIKGVVNEGDE